MIQLTYFVVAVFMSVLVAIFVVRPEERITPSVVSDIPRVVPVESSGDESSAGVYRPAVSAPSPVSSAPRQVESAKGPISTPAIQKIPVPAQTGTVTTTIPRLAPVTGTSGRPSAPVAESPVQSQSVPSQSIQPVQPPAPVVSSQPSLTPASSQPVVSQPSAGSYWRPRVGDSWNIQYGAEALDLTNSARIYVVDAVDTAESAMRQLHDRGTKIICYINAGAWEDWRPDADKFPKSIIGKDYQGWPGENWFDIRDTNDLRPLLIARLDAAKAKGCDGIDPDNINGYQNDTGFPLTASDQLVFNKWLANAAHARGLAIGLKNDSEQIDDLLSYFDFSVTEGCAVEGWCATLKDFVTNGKPIFQIEYDDTAIDFNKACAESKSLGFSMILKHRNLDAWAKYCD